MRHLAFFLLFFVSLGNAHAVDLGQQQPTIKDNSHMGMNPGQPDGRQGGETIADAVVIPGLPFMDTGNTSDNTNDYDAACPYTTSTAPDVVYSFLPDEDMFLSIDLCGSGYDTKTYVMDEAMNIIACNDDYYFDDSCGVYVSFIESASLTSGNTYFIIVDGYGEDAGDYILNVEVFTPPPPCILTCEGIEEGEPPLQDGYEDNYNTGCNHPNGVNPFQTLVGDANGELVFCGKSGWYSPDGVAEYRDTDWFHAVIGPTGVIEWTLEAEQSSWGRIRRPHDCSHLAVYLEMEVAPCTPGTLVSQGTPGDIEWIIVYPTGYTPPNGFEGHEFNYVCTFVGLQETTVSTEKITLDRIKTLYR